MKPSRRTQTAAEPEQQAPGAFMPDGSWNPHSEMRHRGQIHRLVVALCRERRSPNLTPEQAANTIIAANATLAFPSHRQWMSADHWSNTQAVTAAEEAVKREGRSVYGHWCGEHWEAGPEVACGEPRHREKPAQAEVQQMLERIRATLPALGPMELTP